MGSNDSPNSTLSGQTGNQGLIKDLNKRIVLNVIWGKPSISRAQIARMTGLNRSTVSSLVDELIADGYVAENGVGDSPLGRKPIMLRVNRNAGVVVGIDLGVNYVTLALSDFRAGILFRKDMALRPPYDQEKILDSIMATIEELLKKAPPSVHGLLGIGIAVPGLVESDTGMLVFAPNLKWRNVPMKDIFESRFNATTLIDNEANVGATGEKLFGAGREIQNMVYLSVGMGIGAGIVMNGDLYRGSSGYSGEIGHVTVKPDGPLCACGNRGCWETLASEGAAIARATEAMKRKPSMLSDVAASRAQSGEDGALTIDDLIAACDAHDDVALKVLNETGTYLGIGMAGIVNTFNPDLVVVGNTIGQCGDYVLAEAIKEMNARSLSHLSERVRVEQAQLGKDVSVMGAVSLVLDKYVSIPSILLV